MLQTRDLESIAAAVMIPLMMWDEVWNDSNMESCGGISAENYKNRLDGFAFSEERDYEGFRNFLSEYPMIFGKNLHLTRNLTNSEIDYVFGRIVEERKDSAIVH